MKNDYTLLQKENKLRAGCLNTQNQEALIRMVPYLEGRGLNPYDSAVMQKELISMALAAEVRQQTLEEALGMPEQEFCDGLAGEGRRMTFADWAAFYLPPFLRVITTSQILLGFMTGALLMGNMVITFGMLVFYLVFMVLYFGVNLWTGTSIYLKGRKHMLIQIVSVIVIMVLMGFLVIGARTYSVTYWEVPALANIGGWTVLWFLSEWYQKKRAADLAAVNPWMDC